MRSENLRDPSDLTILLPVPTQDGDLDTFLRNLQAAAGSLRETCKSFCGQANACTDISDYSNIPAANKLHDTTPFHITMKQDPQRRIRGLDELQFAHVAVLDATVAYSSPWPSGDAALNIVHRKSETALTRVCEPGQSLT